MRLFSTFFAFFFAKLTFAVQPYVVAQNAGPLVDYYEIAAEALSDAINDLGVKEQGFFEKIKTNPQFRQNLLAKTEQYLADYPSFPLEMQHPEGRMPLPTAFIGTGPFSRLMDGGFLLEELKPTPRQAAAMYVFSFRWSIEVQLQQDQTFNALLESRSNETPDQYDIIRFMLMGHIKSDYGFSMSKLVWSKLHKSKNSIYRLMALDKFDAVEQSPSELMALYRECLFGSCSYLEIRALESILRNRDFRPEVAQLLNDYLASSPLQNDGTVPNNRVLFQSPLDGARQALKLISEFAISSPAKYTNSNKKIEKLKSASATVSNPTTDHHINHWLVLALGFISLLTLYLLLRSSRRC